MRATFNQVILTASRSSMLTKDMQVTPMPNLHTKTIAQKDAIGPVDAVDATIVFGPQSVVITGYRDSHILDYETRLIDKDLFEASKQIAHQTYKGGRHLKVDKFDKTEVTGTRDVHVTGEDTENYDVHREIHEPVKYEISSAKLEHTWFALGTKGLVFEGTAAKFAAEGAVAPISLCENLNKGIKVALEPLQAKANGLEGKIGVFAAKLIGTYDGLPSPSIIAPCD